MKEQEEAMKKKYGGMMPGKKKKGLLGGAKRQYFDSADQFSGKETGKEHATAAKIPHPLGSGGGAAPIDEGKAVGGGQ